MTQHIREDEDEEEQAEDVQRLCARIGCPRYSQSDTSLCYKCDTGPYLDGF